MKFSKTPILLLLATIIIVILLSFRIQDSGNSVIPNSESVLLSDNCIPTFADGGGPYYENNAPFRDKIAPDENNGTRLVISGMLLMNDCKTAVPNAVLDIWQANESGDYHDSWYRGKVTTDRKGRYSFETVVPKGYGEGTGYRPPHIHFKVFKDDREIITSQMFFPETKGTPGFDDAYIMTIEEKTKNGLQYLEGTHNIILP